MSVPSLSVVIPTRNGAARLRPTLASIAAQQVAGSFEVVIADDGSDDGVGAVAARFDLPWQPARVVRHESSRGRAAACNSGTAAATGEIIVLLDDDMTLQPGALEAHRAFHSASPGAAARARVVLADTGADTCFLRFLAREEATQERSLEDRREALPFPLCQTGHFSIRRSVLIAAGGLDATITRYGFEDIELGYRLGQLGVPLAYLPAASSIHRAYITDLERYLERHLEAGSVARQLVERYPSGPFRGYLRVDPPRELGLGRDPAGLVGLRISNGLLLRPLVRRAIGGRFGFHALRLLLRAAERMRFDRAAHFGYHVARDVRYFQGYFGESPHAAGR